jgi:hypothetical protein
MDTTFEPAVAVTGELDELNPDASVEAREVFVLLLPYAADTWKPLTVMVTLPPSYTVPFAPPVSVEPDGDAENEGFENQVVLQETEVESESSEPVPVVVAVRVIVVPLSEAVTGDPLEFNWEASEEAMEFALSYWP